MYAAYLEDKKNYEAQSDWKIAQATVKSLEDFKKFREKLLYLKADRSFVVLNVKEVLHINVIKKKQ